MREYSTSEQVIGALHTQIADVMDGVRDHRVSKAILTFSDMYNGDGVPDEGKRESWHMHSGELDDYSRPPEEGQNKLTEDYIRFLRFFGGYIHTTVPLLREAQEALVRIGDGVWAEKFLGYVQGEQPHEGGDDEAGHEKWIYDDLRALGVAEGDLETEDPLTTNYGLHFRTAIRNGAPFSFLGAKVLLEGVSASMSPPYTTGLERAQLSHAASFFGGHVIDEQHFPEAVEDLRPLDDEAKLSDVGNGIEYAANFFKSGLKIF